MGEKKPIHDSRRELLWQVIKLFHLDFQTTQRENKAQIIIHLQQIENHLLNVFIDAYKVTKSFIQPTNTGRVTIPNEYSNKKNLMNYLQHA